MTENRSMIQAVRGLSLVFLCTDISSVHGLTGAHGKFGLDDYWQPTREVDSACPISHGQLVFVFTSAAELACGSDRPRPIWQKQKMETWAD